jgi:DNA-binding GntR family transcriptional regulator
MAGTGRVTTYGTLAASLRDDVLSGRYGDGDQLPTEAQLASTHGVSRQTVRRAMLQLVGEGLVYRVAGRGTYPVDQSERYLRHQGSIEDLMGLSIDTDCVIVEPLRRRVDVVAAGRLRLDVDDVHTVSFVRRHGTVPFCHTTVTVPTEIGAELERVRELTTAGTTSRVTVIGLVDDHPDRTIRDAEQSITASLLPPELVPHLTCEPDSPVLRIDRLYRDLDETPVELAVSHFDPRYYSYRVSLRRHPL